jgi:S-adenosylmethionine hydrolase
MAPIITLTTDFGVQDPFAGIMKGVILGICPEVRLVDLTHEIPAQDVLAGALAIESAAPYFPAGTIHLAVVDPGVGSARRALAIASRGQLFVGPDNGLLSFALAADGWSAVALEAPPFRLTTVSRTFHGRDVFAPAAAHLARGVPLRALGPAVTDPARLAIPECRIEGAEVVGEVIGADRFGNLLTSITGAAISGQVPALDVTVALGGRDLGTLAGCYAEGEPDRPAAIIGSTGRLEIFVRNGSALGLLGARRGAPVRVRPAGSGGAR